MANRTLSYGSSGEDVKKLQKSLNDKGYSLEVDGEFGPKTQEAVKAYQKKSGLSVDGIVGVNTWASLSAKTKTENKKENSSANKNTGIKPPTENVRPEYKKSENIISVENNLNEWEKNKPGEFVSKYSDEIENILQGILNRERFNFNINADPLYNQYREQYINNGKKAMMDTIAQSSALTGGYSNSYATVAGNQVFNDYLNNLNNVALDLYDRAYSAYNDEGKNALEKMSVLSDLEKSDYNKYRDNFDDYYKNGEYLLEKLSEMSDAEYKMFLDDLESFENDRDYNYQKYLDALKQQNFYDELKFSEEKFLQELAFKKSEAERDQQNKDRSYALSVAKSSSSTSSSSSKKTSESSSELKTTSIIPRTYQQFIYLTGYSGILTEKEFNLRSSAKKEYGSYENYIKEMYYKYGEGRDGDK